MTIVYLDHHALRKDVSHAILGAMGKLDPDDVVGKWDEQRLYYPHAWALRYPDDPEYCANPLSAVQRLWVAQHTHRLMDNNNPTLAEAITLTLRYHSAVGLVSGQLYEHFMFAHGSADIRRLFSRVHPLTLDEVLEADIERFRAAKRAQRDNAPTPQWHQRSDAPTPYERQCLPRTNKSVYL